MTVEKSRQEIEKENMAVLDKQSDPGIMNAIASDLKTGEARIAGNKAISENGTKEIDGIVQKASNTGLAQQGPGVSGKTMSYSQKVIQDFINQTAITEQAQKEEKMTQDKYNKTKNTMDQLSNLSPEQLSDPNVLKMLKYSNPDWDITKIKEKAQEWKKFKDYFGNLPMEAKVSEAEEKAANAIGMQSKDYRNNLIGIAGTFFNVVQKAAENTGEAFPDSAYAPFGVEAKNRRAKEAADLAQANLEEDKAFKDKEFLERQRQFNEKFAQDKILYDAQVKNYGLDAEKLKFAKEQFRYTKFMEIRTQVAKELNEGVSFVDVMKGTYNTLKVFDKETYDAAIKNLPVLTVAKLKSDIAEQRKKYPNLTKAQFEAKIAEKFENVNPINIDNLSKALEESFKVEPTTGTNEIIDKSKTEQQAIKDEGQAMADAYFKAKAYLTSARISDERKAELKKALAEDLKKIKEFNKKHGTHYAIGN